jgi:tRNA-modifying protein YgfZ
VSVEEWKAVYESLTTSGGVVMLSDWTQVQLAGNDRVKFLHNMCTNDIRRLEPGSTCEAFCTDVKGKILAHVFVIAEAEQLTLLSVPNQAERIIQHLDRYIIREDVKLADVSRDFDWCLVVGPQTMDTSVDDAAFAVNANLFWPGGRLVRTTESAGRVFGSLPVIGTASPAWTALRTESCFPLYGIDFDDSHLPQEINRDTRAISFTKGCYLGQETVARIDALGHVNKKLVLVKFAGERVPTAGAKLTQGEHEVGVVTTGSWSPRYNAPLAIAFIRRGANDIGSRLQSDFGEVEVIMPASIN